MKTTIFITNSETQETGVEVIREVKNITEIRKIAKQQAIVRGWKKIIINSDFEYYLPNGVYAWYSDKCMTIK